MRVGSHAIGRPYVVGLIATVTAGSLTAVSLLAVAHAQARTQVREQEATAVIDTLPLPPFIEPMTTTGDCRQVTIDRCLTSVRTPPATLGPLTDLVARYGTVTGAGCGESSEGDAPRPEARRCSFEAEFDGIPVRVLLWPHVAEATEESATAFRGTEIWVDIVTTDDL